MFKKRLFAYIIDIFILSLVLSFISLLIPDNASVVNLENELIDVNNNFINGSIDLSTFFNQYSSISYSMDKELFLTSLASAVVTVLYFVIFPLYNNGQSIGKKVFGLKIVSNDLSDVSSNGLLIRYLLMHGIGTSIICMCLVFILKDFSYVVFVSLLSFLQFLVEIISVFMVIYRHDFRSLPDLIAGTKVIEVKK